MIFPIISTLFFVACFKHHARNHVHLKKKKKKKKKKGEGGLRERRERDTASRKKVFSTEEGHEKERIT